MNNSYLRSKSMNTYSTGYTDFLSQWEWDLHMIFHFHELRKYKQVSLGFAIKKVKSFLWSEKRRSFRSIKFAGIMVAVRKGSTHCHVLLLSDPNYPKRLNSLDDESLIDLELSWKHGALLIQKVYFNQGICGYLASGRNIDVSDPDGWAIEFFRSSVLAKLNDRANGTPIVSP